MTNPQIMLAPLAARLFSSLSNERPQTKKARLTDKEVFAKTIYAEVRNEELEGQKWFAWVIKNRARMNKPYWGGGSIRAVCLHPGEFECWNGKSDIVIDEPVVYAQIKEWSDQIFDAPHSQDPTGGADRYVDKCDPMWTNNCKSLQQIGHHQFYHSL